MTVLFVLLLFVSPLLGGSLRVATFNLENYVCQSRMVDKLYRNSYPKPESEKLLIRKSILSLSADILVVQEMGGEAYLRELQRDLRRLGLKYEYTYLSVGEDSVRNLALLSKIPFTHSRSIQSLHFNYFDQRTKLKRGLMEVGFSFEGERLVLYAFHLKSAYAGTDEDPIFRKYREKEARVIRDYIQGQSVGKYILLGDLNDKKNSPAFRRLTRFKSERISLNISCKDFQGEGWTYYFEREESYSKLDYIFVSPPLLPHVYSSGIDSPGLLFQGSDHRPIYIDLMF